jgi:hypothetical protein
MIRRVLTATLGVAFSLVVAACDNDDDLETQTACIPASNLACGGEVRRSTIDTDEGFDTRPGEGVGVFVEYEADGRFRISTTCDSVYNGYACYFDILVSVAEGETIRDFQLEGVGDSAVDLVEEGVVSFRSVTDYDVEGFSVWTAPGAVLSVDVLLDCGCGNPYVFWIGDGAIHSGAPSNPLELEPSTP